MARPTKLTPEIHRRIVGYVRAGSFETNAAAAAGVHPSTLRRWKRRGATPGSEAIYRAFLHDLEQAVAEALVIAESRVFQENPFAWLRYGPGRERPGRPGWTDRRQVELSGRDGGAIPIKLIDQITKKAGLA